MCSSSPFHILRVICSCVSSSITVSSRQSHVLLIIAWCPAHSKYSITVTEYGNEWTNTPWSPNLYCSAPSTAPKDGSRKVGWGLLLAVSKCLMLLQQTIPFLLLYYCLALSDADVSYFLSRSRLRKHLSFEEYKMKVDGGVSPLSEVSTFNYWKLKWLLWCSNIFSCALY